MGNPVVEDLNAVFTDLTSYGATYLTPEEAHNGNSILLNSVETGDLLTNLEKYESFSIPLMARENQKRGHAAAIVSTPTQISHEIVTYLGLLGHNSQRKMFSMSHQLRG